jgi:predicted transcriptional regulator
VPALNGRTKSLKIILKEKKNTVTAKKKPSKKRWKLLNDLKGQKSEAARKIVEQILDLMINPVIVKNILALSLIVQ